MGAGIGHLIVKDLPTNIKYRRDSHSNPSGSRTAPLNQISAEKTRTIPPLLSLDGLALVAVFVQITELYRPFGYLLGFPNSLWVNTGFLIFFSAYLVARIATIKKFRSNIITAWCWALVGVPLLVMCLQLLDDSVTANRLAYWVIFTLLFTLLLLVVIVLWSRWGPSLSRPFFVAAIGAAWLGFAVNWVDYQFLREVMAHGSISIWVSEYTTRAIGFYQHPNAAAFSLVLYFTCLACDKRFVTGSIFIQAFAAMASLVGVLITGSRTSLLLLAISFAWYFWNLAKPRGGSSFGALETVRQRALVAPLIPLAVLSMSIVLLQIITVSRRDLASMVTLRLQSLTDLGSDISTGQRITMITRYYSDLIESPLLGHGPDFATQQIATGTYLNVSQNAWLEWSVAFGVPYALFMAALLFATYRYTERHTRSQPFLHSLPSLVIIIFVLISFSMVNPFWMRSPICTLGVLLGLVIHAGQNTTFEQLRPSIPSGRGKRRRPGNAPMQPRYHRHSSEARTRSMSS